MKITTIVEIIKIDHRLEKGLSFKNMKHKSLKKEIHSKIKKKISYMSSI
jgi:hypothetical protein